MATITLDNGRKIEITDVQYGTEPEDCIILSATFVDSGDELTNDELDACMNDSNIAELLHSLWYERQIERAEHVADMREDR